MHDLFLGTAKHVLKDIWLARGLISTHQLEEIQARVDNVVVPPNVGRIPKKISSAFAGFTADQWKNWTIIYSLYALRDILAPPHYHCWESFVIACRLMCSTLISVDDLQKADMVLMHFCRRFEQLYGKEAVIPRLFFVQPENTAGLGTRLSTLYTYIQALYIRPSKNFPLQNGLTAFEPPK